MGNDGSAYFDKISERYQDAQSSWDIIYHQINIVIEPLIKDKVVLDIGNGGTFVYDTHAPKKVIALDISAKMLEAIKDEHVVKIVSDARDLKQIEDNSVDVVLYMLCIHHIQEKTYYDSLSILREVITAAKSKLTNGGYIIIAEPCVSWFYHSLERILFPFTRFALSLIKSPMIFFHTAKTFQSYLSEIFGVSTDKIISKKLQLKGWSDPLGGSLPGLIKIPSNISPTRFYLFCLKK